MTLIVAVVDLVLHLHADVAHLLHVVAVLLGRRPRLSAADIPVHRLQLAGAIKAFVIIRFQSLFSFK